MESFFVVRMARCSRACTDWISHVKCFPTFLVRAFHSSFLCFIYLPGSDDRWVNTPGDRHKSAVITGQQNSNNVMINWAITFLVIALIAAALGFGGIAGTAVGLAKILFFVFIVLFIIAFVMGRKAPPV